MKTQQASYYLKIGKKKRETVKNSLRLLITTLLRKIAAYSLKPMSGCFTAVRHTFKHKVFYWFTQTITKKTLIKTNT